MCGFIFDPSKTNLRKTLKEYEELALRYIWETGDEGAGSGLTWRAVNERLEEGKTISRASIIFFLNRMLDQDVLTWRDATGKGGHHKIYITKLDENGYKKYVIHTLLDSVAKDFPEATEEVLKSF